MVKRRGNTDQRAQPNKRGLKQGSFWTTHVARNCALFHFDMPCRYQICLAKRLYSYADDLPIYTGSSLLKKAKRPLPVDVLSNRLI